MCRLFGLHAGRNDVSATLWLLDAPDSLVVQSHLNPDGAGVGVFGPGGRPTVEKQPLAAWQDRDFATAAHTLRGTTFLAHVRYASTGELSMVNTHPFLLENRLFAHNGVVFGLAELDRRLDELGARGLVRGETDSERIFALITAEIARHDDDVEQGIVAAVSWIADHLPLYALNILVTTATDLWALRYPGSHQLFVLERPANRATSLEARSGRICASSEELTGGACVVLATERMDAEPGWRLLEPGELLHVDADLTITSRTPFSAVPRHLLELAELQPAAAASQHPGPVAT